MLFPTATFAIFFLVVLTLAVALSGSNGARKGMLLAASYVFYGWWDWRFCALLFTSSFLAWLGGHLLPADRGETYRKWVVAVLAGALLALLGFFKYFEFFLESLRTLFFRLGIERDLPLVEIILPVGISFFIFQSISYLVDCYRREFDEKTSLSDVLLYVSFFPQLVAGPIVRASDFIPQLSRTPRISKADFCFGGVLIVIGLAKKMIVAHYLATLLVDDVFLDPASHSSGMLLLAVYGYAVQIYCDFSGYSDMAIGFAALLGYRFPRNFDNPYRALSLSEFWRRWHISLSTWLRDYLYIPLGGSRVGPWKTYRNLFLTMFLGGIWHGAAWTFLIWGTLHGTALIAERLALRAASGSGFRLPPAIAWLVTFHFVCATWVFFRASDLPAALAWFQGFAAMDWSFAGTSWLSVALIAIVLASQVRPHADPRPLSSRVEQLPAWLLPLVFGLAVQAIVWAGPSGTAPFIYFQF